MGLETIYVQYVTSFVLQVTIPCFFFGMYSLEKTMLQNPGIGSVDPNAGSTKALSQPPNDLHQVKPLAQILSTMPLSEWRGSITTFNGFTGTRPVRELDDVGWEVIKGVIASAQPAILNEKKDAQYVVPCLLKDAPLVGNTLEAAISNGQPTTGKMRSKQHMTFANYLVMDIDGIPKAEFNAALQKMSNDGLTYAAYTTHSHGREDKPGVRARIVVPFDRPLNIVEYPAAWHGFDSRYFNGQAGKADASGANMYQQQGTRCCHPDRRAQAKSWHNQGGVASADALISIHKDALAAKADQAGIPAAKSAKDFKVPSSARKVTTDLNSDYPPSDANKVADACPQIGTFRDTGGATQSEPSWFNCLGVVGHCVDGEKHGQEWSSGHAGYDPRKTAAKLAYRMKMPPTTCEQFKKTNPDGCAGCIQTCHSPITLGWADREDFEVIESPAVNSTEAAKTVLTPDPITSIPSSPSNDAKTIASLATTNVPPEIAALNNNFAYIEKEAAIYRLEYNNFIEPAKFRLQHDNHKVDIRIGDRAVTIGVGSAWLNSPTRRQHKALALRPDEGSVTKDNCLNEWKGFAIPPIAGNVKPFLRLLLRLVPSRAERRFVLRWMAHLIQRPGIKMFVSLAFWSHVEGVGKNLLFELLDSIIGPAHSTVIGQKELLSSFNDWANRRIFVIGDEVSGNDKRQERDTLKGLITGTNIHINEKYQPDRVQPNLLNFVFLSNHHDALFLNDHDRRFFVWEIESEKLPEVQAIKFVQWRDSIGLSALHYFLLNYPLGDFNPKAPAPMTAAKMQMADDNRSDLEAWIAEVMASNVVQEFGRELATANEIGRAYAASTEHGVPSSKAIVGACKRLGAVARPNQVRLVGGKKVRPSALARPEFWKLQSESAWAVEMAKEVSFEYVND